MGGLAASILARIWPYLLAAAVGAGGAWWAQGLRLDAIRADLRAANDRLAIVDAANAQCAADVQETRQAVFALKQAAQARQKAADAAVAAAEAKASEFEGRAAELAERDAGSADQCAAVDSLTRDYIRGRR